jgi:hypothetical protein
MACIPLVIPVYFVTKLLVDWIKFRKHKNQFLKLVVEKYAGNPTPEQLMKIGDDYPELRPILLAFLNEMKKDLVFEELMKLMKAMRESLENLNEDDEFDFKSFDRRKKSKNDDDD